MQGFRALTNLSFVNINSDRRTGMIVESVTESGDVHKCDSEASPHLLLYRSRGRRRGGARWTPLMESRLIQIHFVHLTFSTVWSPQKGDSKNNGFTASLLALLFVLWGKLYRIYPRLLLLHRRADRNPETLFGLATHLPPVPIP